MTHPIIKTDNYILITSNEEIKEGDYYYDQNYPNQIYIRSNDNKFYIGPKKIIAHLPLGDSAELKLPLLPPLPNEDDEIIENLENYLLKVNQLYKDWLGIGFKGGYHKAKEKYKFTEEDMIKVIDYCKHNRAFEYDFEKVMESLSQPKLPVGFKCEIEVDCTGNDNNGCFMDAPGHNCGCVKTKIINGVMQGEWIY